MDAVGPNHEALVEVAMARHLTAVVAGKSDRVQIGPRRMLDRGDEIAGAPARRQRQDDVARPSVRDQLPDEDQLESDVVGRAR